MMAQLKELELANQRLKKMYAEECLKTEAVREAIEKWRRHLGVKRGFPDCMTTHYFKRLYTLSKHQI